MKTPTIQRWNGQEVPISFPETHTISRSDYPPGYGGRLDVPDALVSWETPFPGYEGSRVGYVAKSVLDNYPNGWAHSPNVLEVPRDQIRSYTALAYNANGFPLNPVGRTGFGPERGLLGKWGANFAADPFVTWLDDAGELWGLFIERADSSEIALPGGMAEKDEPLGSTLRRELGEETSVHLDMEGGTLIYAGYVDDRRNGDHSWMETIVVHLHVPYETAKTWKLKGDHEIKRVLRAKLTLEFANSLYASHGLFVKLALKKFAEANSKLNGLVSAIVG